MKTEKEIRKESEIQCRNCGSKWSVLLDGKGFVDADLLQCPLCFDGEEARS